PNTEGNRKYTKYGLRRFATGCENGRAYDPPPPLIEVATLLNVVLAFAPIDEIAVKHTITIRAHITAYSTAVGPSSLFRKRRNFRAKLFIETSDSAVFCSPVGRVFPEHTVKNRLGLNPPRRLSPRRETLACRAASPTHLLMLHPS